MEEKAIPFRWRYIALPVAILLLSAALAVGFYHLLPDEISYRFKDGSPGGWVGRGAFLAWTLAPQLFFALLSAAIVWGAARLSALFRQAESNRAGLGKILALMGNMVALPQVIICFAMLDVFLYNSYQIHLMSLLTLALIVMGLGMVTLGLAFALAIRQARRLSAGRK